MGKMPVLPDNIELLVGCCASETSLLLHIRADFDKIEIGDADGRVDIIKARIPCCFQVREVLPYKRGQGIYLLRSLVAAHKADAGYTGRILVYQKGEEMCVKRHALVSPEPWAMAARAPVGTTRYVECKGYLVRNLLTYNIKIIALDHFGKLYLYVCLLFLGHLLCFRGLLQLFNVCHCQGGSYLSVILGVVAAGCLFLPWS